MAAGVLGNEPGVVLDFTSISGTYSSYTFSSGTTYRLTGNVTITGSATINGGAVIKYNASTGLIFQGAITGPSSTTYFTAVDDHTVGEQITSSDVSGTYASTALYFSSIPYNLTINNLEVRHASTAVSVYATSAYNYTFGSPRVIYCSTGFTASGGTYVTVNNPCFNNVTTQYSGIYSHSGDTTCANNSPTISDIPSFSMNEDSVGEVNMTVKDVETPSNITNASFGKSSSNSTLLPTSGIVISGSGPNRSITVYPTSNASGSSTVTITVYDGTGGSAQDQFTVTVNAVNDAPAISSIQDRSTGLSTTSPEIIFTVSDTEDSAGSLSMGGSASPSGLVQTPFTFGGSGATRTVKITAVEGQPGTAAITLTVSDSGGAVGYRNFNLTITPDHTNPDGYRYEIGDPSPGTPASGSFAPNPSNSSAGDGSVIGGGGGGGASGGGGSFWGPAGPVDLNAIRI